MTPTPGRAPTAEHLTFIVLGDWRKEAMWTSGLRRIQRPATVTYRTNTYLWVPELDQEVTLRRDAGTDPVPWIGQEGVASGAVTPEEPGERISGTLTNVASLLIDLDKACLNPGADIDLDIRTDGPTVVRFSDHRPPTLLAHCTG